MACACQLRGAERFVRNGEVHDHVAKVGKQAEQEQPLGLDMPPLRASRWRSPRAAHWRASRPPHRVP